MRRIDLEKLSFRMAEVPNDLGEARCRIEEPILADIRALGYSPEDEFAIRLALEEAVSNAYKHGNKGDPNKRIRARWAATPEVTVIYVSDDGGGFDPQTVPDPRTDENVQRPCGRGIMLMRAYMTQVQYSQRGNEVCLIRIRQ